MHSDSHRFKVLPPAGARRWALSPLGSGLASQGTMFSGRSHSNLTSTPLIGSVKNLCVRTLVPEHYRGQVCGAHYNPSTTQEAEASGLLRAEAWTTYQDCIRKEGRKGGRKRKANTVIHNTEQATL